MIRDQACSLCKLGSHAEPIDTCVPGKGGSKIMIVTKLPLSTRRRNELGDYLEGAGIPAGDAFFTAASRCRVWDLEASKSDIKACRTYLDQEIDDVKPKLIIPLGNEALLSVTGHSGITKYRGKKLEHKASGTPVIATISPAMVARNPGLRGGLLADLAYIRRQADPETASEGVGGRTLGVYKLPGLGALTERLRTCEGVAVDIETNRFEEWLPDSVILSVSFTCWSGGEPGDPDFKMDRWALPLAHPESPWLKSWRIILRQVYEQGLKYTPKVIAHNGKFDLRWLHHFHCPVWLTFDTMLAAHLLDENQPKSLEALARILTSSPPWKIDNKNLITEPLHKVLRYNGLDTWNTALIYFKLRRMLIDRPRLGKLMLLLMVPGSNDFVDIERAGIWTDRERLATRYEIAKNTLEDIDAKLHDYVPEDMWDKINFNPSNFMRWWFFEHLGYPVLERGKTKEDGTPGDPSVKEAVMLQLQADNPDDEVLKLLIERTKWQKYSTAFLSAYMELIDDEDRIHTTFKLTGTVTGRLSSGKDDTEKVTGRVQNRGVNLQQVPRDKFIRGVFGAPLGSVFVECDYSQVELRVAAYLARERTMLSLYRSGQDIHMTMAMRMTGKPESEVTKEERKKAKAVNFGFLYGMGWKKFISTAFSNYGVVVTEQESRAFRTAFFDQFSDLPAWHQRQRRLAHTYKRVESPLGRIRHLPDIDSPNEDIMREAERQAINSPVQSFASDMALLSLIRLKKKLPSDVHIVGTVHDAINFEVPVDLVPRVVPTIRRTMEQLPLKRLFGVELDVPIVADAKIGTRWGDSVEVPNDISESPELLDAWIQENSALVGIG